jgi:hypothetical protein
MVTLSVGGNDADFSTLLNYCIYQWLTLPWYGCDAALQDTQNTINSAAYTTDLTNLISAIKGKLSDPSNRIYWVGYGKFFGELENEFIKLPGLITYILQTPQLLSATT